jgi:hypothetical protein
MHVDAYNTFVVVQWSDNDLKSDKIQTKHVFVDQEKSDMSTIEHSLRISQ